MTAPLVVVDLGRQPYGSVHRLQRELAEQRIAGTIEEDLLLLVEHDPVVTLGRATRAESLPLSREVLAARGVEVVEVERGGDVTYHGPGQLVGYPILDLKNHRQDLHWYLRQIETALIQALDRLSIPAERNPGYTGVWTGGRKIASIGVHVRQWVTTHGFALNVLEGLSGFDLIVPCGIPGVRMTCVLGELGTRPLDGEAEQGDSVIWERTSNAVTQAFADVFQRTAVRDALRIATPAA